VATTVLTTLAIAVVIRVTAGQPQPIHPKNKSLVSFSGPEMLFPNYQEIKVMQENRTIKFDDLDQVLCAARLRRSADLGRWLREYFEGRRETKQLKEMANLLNATATSHRSAT
jgi:hypothetical protein